jgi:hypothetical protein
MEALILLALVIGVPVGLLVWVFVVFGNIVNRRRARLRARKALSQPNPPRSRYATFKP